MKEGLTMTGLQSHACHYQPRPIYEPVTDNHLVSLLMYTLQMILPTCV